MIGQIQLVYFLILESNHPHPAPAPVLLVPVFDSTRQRGCHEETQYCPGEIGRGSLVKTGRE